MIAAIPTSYEHIALDDQGVPWITAANTKVVELVASVKAHAWSPRSRHFSTRTCFLAMSRVNRAFDHPY